MYLTKINTNFHKRVTSYSCGINSANSNLKIRKIQCIWVGSIVLELALPNLATKNLSAPLLRNLF